MSETIQDKEKAPLKVKKPRKLTNKKVEETIKVDLSKSKDKEEITKVELKQDLTKEKQPETEVTIEEIKDEVVKDDAIKIEKKIDSPIIELVEEETKKVDSELKEAVRDEKILGKKLPENIEKLVSFMEETGGNVEDYVRLNTDYSNISPDALLEEYYKKTKPHLEKEEIDFIMEDNFTWDEEVEEERDIKKKKLALKEEIAKAKNFLEETKSKYYDEIKLRPGVTQEQQKATDFFNRYNKEQQIAQQHHENFQQSTNKLFTDEFKGFEFNLGEKKFRYSVGNTNDVIEKQSNLNTFVKKFLNDKGEVVDTVGYHKAIYAADNADTIANHFYEQGKADAVKNMMAKSKNINQDPRPQVNGDVFIGGLKVKAVNGVDSSKLKFKSKKQ